jgi:hypothetical protein
MLDCTLGDLTPVGILDAHEENSSSLVHGVLAILINAILSLASGSEYPQANASCDFVPHFAQLPKLCIWIAHSFRWIIEAPVSGP